MRIYSTNDSVLLDQADRLLYRVLWEPHDMPRNIRSTFPVEGNEYTFVAEDNGLVAGCLILIVSEGESAEIRHVAVDKKYQGKGIGTSFVKEAMNFLREKKMNRDVFLYSRDHAVIFYEKMGFESADTFDELPIFKAAGVKFKKLWKKIN